MLEYINYISGPGEKDPGKGVIEEQWQIIFYFGFTMIADHDVV